MHLVVFGLSISSSWGNGHATLWRGLLKAMAARGHTLCFYEKDVPYYASTRDGWECPSGIRLRLYDSLDSIQQEAMHELAAADVALCTSYCPDGPRASRMIWDSNASIKGFYDLDTPVTLSALRSGLPVSYLPAEGLDEFEVVFSYTGGKALLDLQSVLKARFVVPLYGSVDPEVHNPVAPASEFRSDLCFLGTYADDRQRALEELFLKPASRMPEKRFVIAGAQYPEDFPWQRNIFFMRHLPPSLHPQCFCSARATLNITRRAMADYGYCPSGRLFEAAACGTAILSDSWEGLATFFVPGEEILVVESSDDVCDALSLSDEELQKIGTAARERALEQHTASHRVAEFERICEEVLTRSKSAVGT